MRIALNLATRPFADVGPSLKRLRIAMAVLAVTAIALGIGLHAVHREAQQARERIHSLDAQIAGIQRERQDDQRLMSQPDNARLLAQVSRLNQLIDEKAFSWTLAIEDLETVMPGGVQVTALEPARDKDGHITLQLRVLGPRDKAVDMVRNLEHSRHFAQARIVGESSESQGGPNQRMEPVSLSSRVNFDVLADYIPPTAAEQKRGQSPARHRADGAAGQKTSQTDEPARMETNAGRKRMPYVRPVRPDSPRKPVEGGPR
ncbi:MAG TPA: fimbrial assembly protein [Terracidiphilus sp.]|nr:fimbrial assembly protein [Terracidiphilus sp.]